MPTIKLNGGTGPPSFSITDSKPIITYAGDQNLFTSLEERLVKGIPQEATVWKRSLARKPREIYTEASFIPFNKTNFPKDGDWRLINQPIFHTYWTDCVDVDTYKSHVRENIETWLKVLHQHNIADWLIVLVETYDTKRGNKLLPRTTVLDKIRNDFASKHADRCISVINPIRSESRSGETWRCLLNRIRTLLLQSYDTTIVRFEETVRRQRESRNERGWTFRQYFLLQEELAFVFEMLGMYDDALVQYEELDALFTTWVLHCKIKELEIPDWMKSFQRPIESWTGLQLTHKVNEEQRHLLEQDKASLLQFRSYLFSRQCAMLLFTLNPCEIAKRTLPFLHNCVQELNILEVQCPPGAVDAWVFLGCLEVLRTCEKFSDSVQAYSLYTASLWAYASEKLNDLGELCGLLPGMEPSSEQLHLVVGLSSGMGDVDPPDGHPTPTDQLKEALSSTDAFRKHYLEFAELAMGTYKHIGRVRLARHIGRNIAKFHEKLGNHQRACLFLEPALVLLEAEGWQHLAVEARYELALCYLEVKDKERYIKVCSSLASSDHLDFPARLTYMAEMIETLHTLDKETHPVVQIHEGFKICEVEILTEKIKLIPGGEVEIAVKLESLLPEPIVCSDVALSLLMVKAEEQKQTETENNKNAEGCKNPESFISVNNYSESSLPRHYQVKSQFINPFLEKISFQQQLMYQEDHSLQSSMAICQDVESFLRRGSGWAPSNIGSNTQYVAVGSANASDITVEPETNTLILKTKVEESGRIQLGQVSLTACEQRLMFVSAALPSSNFFEVSDESAAISITKGESGLLAGLEQEVSLVITTGSQCINKNTKLCLKTSHGLKTQLKSSSEEPLVQELTIVLPQTEPFQTLSFLLRVLAKLGPQKDSSRSEHEIKLECTCITDGQPVVLQFEPPFSTTLRLHTSLYRKFAQVAITGLNSTMFQIEDARLVPAADDCSVKLVPLNPFQAEHKVVSDGLNMFLLWELEVETSAENKDTIQAIFSMQYRAMSGSDISTHFYTCTFDIGDHKTLLVANARVEPAKGNEFCRASNICHLHMTVERADDSWRSSVMYEVLVDHTMWAVCGRTTGVITLDENKKQTIQLDVMPLVSGYLPIPHVRLSKYIPADQKPIGKDGRRSDASSIQPRREPFSPGQVFNNSKALQVHVLPPVPPGELV